MACIDVNKEKIQRLNDGEIPIYEPGLADLLKDNAKHNRIHFTTDAASGLQGAEAAFICVGTPMSDDGTADLRYVESAARDIGKTMTEYTVIITKSTVPVGRDCRQSSNLGRGGTR